MNNEEFNEAFVGMVIARLAEEAIAFGYSLDEAAQVCREMLSFGDIKISMGAAAAARKVSGVMCSTKK